MTDSQQIPAGWYKHPESGKKQWWDGQAWAPLPEKKNRTLPLWATLTVGGVALLIGVLIGFGSGNGARADLNTARLTIQKLETKVATLEGREDRLGELEAAVAEREAAVQEREDAVSDIEEVIASNTFPGDGLYLVGVDVQPGTYRSEGGANCYWARLNATGDDILDNYYGAGATVLTIQPGDGVVEVSGCAPFTLVG